jgi:hypothetical protein
LTSLDGVTGLLLGKRGLKGSVLKSPPYSQAADSASSQGCPNPALHHPVV